ncbi:HD domain-containing protein [Ornithinimicrobium panacihumi]|uniref:HD domain-containing protein n=1 Tax=Ornithinimicrobium panacihumi TaxID=2008449 RepID=UPI003F8A0AF1
MGADAEALLDRWLQDAARLAPDAGRDLWLAEGSLLLRGWSEPHRRYHTLQHLIEVLAALDELAAAQGLDAQEALVTRAVAWYHDLAYDPRAAPGSNEHRSAALARDHLHRLGVDDRLVDAVETGVLMTVTHQLSPELPHTPGLAVFHDADLWILSAPQARYAAYRTQVREEFAHVPDDAFRAARAAIMGGFLERKRLYLTDHAHERWTGVARANLGREVRELTGGP